ncbi:MAG: hypothetical protein C4343_02625, partial [Chloroflexota bacterium]
MSDPSEALATTQTTGPATNPRLLPVRSAVRRAVEAAWLNLEAAGDLPTLRAGAGDRPAIEVERPANPV